MRTILKTILTLAILVLIGWFGLWWYAQTRLQSGIESWLARVQSQGTLKITYDSITRGTSPLAASVTLNNVAATLQPTPSATPIPVTLPSLGLRIDVANPLVMHVILPGQINVSTPRADLAITFGSSSFAEKLDLHAALAHQPNPFTSSDAAASNINILASSGSLLILHVDSLSAHGTYNRSAGANGAAISAAETLNGIALSPLLTRLASIPFGGKLTQLAASFNISGPVPADLPALIAQFNAIPDTDKQAQSKLALQSLHDWAAQGGNADASLTLVLGPTTLNAGGSVKFDANAQPSGAASLTADHLDALTAAITNAYPQTQDDINNIEAHLSPDLSSSATGGQTLTLQVTYGNGSATVNGQTHPLPPINWNQLENPPTPAPGDGSGAAAPSTPTPTQTP